MSKSIMILLPSVVDHEQVHHMFRGEDTTILLFISSLVTPKPKPHFTFIYRLADIMPLSRHSELTISNVVQHDY